MCVTVHTLKIYPKDNPVLNINKEVGVPIVGFEYLYEISNHGNISNYRKILKTYKINSGYLCIDLTKDCKKYKFLLHRLVAKAFIPNPENKAEVNHKDGNKLNNCVENLEWVTSAENKQHARITGLSEYNIPTKGIKLGRSSKFFNVTFDKTRGKWQGGVRHANKNHFIKRFNTEIEAAKHVNWIIDYLKLDRPKNIID